MIDSFEIQNFRCFESVKVTGLSRINLLVGRNAAGKTTLLESLFLAAGASPEIAFRVKKWRGLPPRIEVSSEPAAYQSLWKDMFFNLDESRHIRIELIKGESILRLLKISYESSQGLLFPPSEPTSSLDTLSTIPITFHWLTSEGQEAKVQPQFTKEGFKVAPATETPPLSAFFFSSVNMPSPEESAGWLSKLSIQGTDRELVEAVQEVFDFIMDLSIQVSAGVPAIYATVRNLNEKVPINLVSSGLTKLMAIILAIVQKKGGLVFIDEIENGFHYEILVPVWKLLSRFAEKYDTQIFASTHSAECLNAATDGVFEQKTALKLLKLQRLDGSSKVKRYSGEALRSAMIDAVEVR